MNSRKAENECFVYITLPGETEFATAGRFVLTTDWREIPTGRFVYGQSYLARGNAVAVDPLELKLGNKTYQTNILKGVFGALRDASPDYWGRRVMEKRSGRTQLGEIEYLLYSPDDRAGAFGFGLNREPPAPRRKFNQTIELERLQALADAIIADEEIPDDADAEQSQDLMFVGTSMGRLFRLHQLRQERFSGHDHRTVDPEHVFIYKITFNRHLEHMINPGLFCKQRQAGRKGGAH